MIYFIVFMFFFLYSSLLFLVKNLYILGLIFIFNLVISILVKISLKKHLKFIASNILFTIFIVLSNLMFSSIIESLRVGIRLFLVIDYTYIMGFFFNETSIRIAFKYLFYPLKLFKINTDNLTLIITVALAFIPVLRDETLMIKYSLKSKGFDFKLKNLIKRPHIYVITFLNGLFDRIDELEKTLKLKAF